LEHEGKSIDTFFHSSICKNADISIAASGTQYVQPTKIIKNNYKICIWQIKKETGIWGG